MDSTLNASIQRAVTTEVVAAEFFGKLIAEINHRVCETCKDPQLTAAIEGKLSGCGNMASLEEQLDTILSKQRVVGKHFNISLADHGTLLAELQTCLSQINAAHSVSQR